MIKKYFKYILFIYCLAYSWSGIAFCQDFNSSNIEYSLYLIGDVGDDTLLSSPTLNILSKHLSNESPGKSAVIFLGDNIYPSGLHKSLMN